MRLNELVSFPGFAWSLMHRHGNPFQLHVQDASPVQGKLVTPGGGAIVEGQFNFVWYAIMVRICQCIGAESGKCLESQRG